MLLCIALPLVSVLVQSVHTPHDAVLIETKNCGPFGCKMATSIDQDATAALRESQPLGKFVGADIFLDRGHLAISEVADTWRSSDGWVSFFSGLSNLPFYRAMSFTLTYTFVVTPLLIILGLMIALAVNSLHRLLKGVVIFFSLLPMIVSPLIGSLVLFWMIDSRGILGSALQWMANDPDLSLKASTGLTWVMLIVYGVWHAAPFAFVVFYAGLQTLSQQEAVTVVGFPCNQFGAQEPGTHQEICDFTAEKFEVDFPLMAKIDVKGDASTPLFQELSSSSDASGYAGDIRWNFEKFVINTDGQVSRFTSRDEPEDLL